MEKQVTEMFKTMQFSQSFIDEVVKKQKGVLDGIEKQHLLKTSSN
jgi:hypothetical protein